MSPLTGLANVMNPGATNIPPLTGLILVVPHAHRR